ncbi:phage tail tape measure protein [Zunongwangia sp. HRR-M8]|uniref:phage tail tape measure protein n=1 Tax=Zunongwangia sp. HRR-M8 TaxID=3015170 RepID=UPI0022DDEE61|nr:phage tail tape measure protein [Zunongwangia sp. HRR-M8]WBL22960.1 phage tail tape measure protein [Zunongwangia sp. HRR-M8]
MGSAIKVPAEFIAVDKFSSVIKRMTSRVSTFSTRAAGLERFNTKLNKFKYHAMAGGAALGVTVNQANDFQKSMGNVSTLIDTNSEDMGKMGDQVLKLSTRLPVPINELTTSLYDIRSAGVSASQAMGTLDTAGKLSVAGLSTASEATNILTSAMNAFKTESLKSEEIGNILFKTVKYGKTTLSQLAQSFGATAPIVQSSGVKLADFSAATAALTTLGTPASTAQNQIRASIVAMQKPTAEMTKIYKNLGVASEKELINKKGSLVGAMQAINEAGGNMGLNMAKAWSSVEAGAAVTALTGSTNKAYLQTLKDMTGSSQELTTAFEKQKNTDSSQLVLAQNNMEALSITIGTMLAPEITNLVKKVIPLIKAFKDWIKENSWLVELIPTVVLGFAAFKGVLWATRAALFINSIAMGVNAARMGAMSLAMNGNKIAMAAFNIYTKAAAAAQWIFNAAMNANPIGLVIAAIVVLIGVVAVIIKYYDKWGAALTLILGPFGAIINIIMGIRKHWDTIVKTFKEDGILAGIKMIGKVIFDSMLYPVEQFLGLLSKIPGVGKYIDPAMKFVENMRANLNLETDQDSNNDAEVTTNKEIPLIPSSRDQQFSQQQSIMQKYGKGELLIKMQDPNNNIKSIESGNSDSLPVKLTPTVGQM